MADPITIRVVVHNTSGVGGTYTTPFWAGFHDNSFDLFDLGSAASAGLEALAEDGNFAPINAELTAADSDAQNLVIAGAAGPIAPQERGAATIEVDGETNGYFSVAGMVLPSNDAFVGNGTALKLFDDAGNFLGAQTLVFQGNDVYDAGTEVNTELDAAFLNQTGPNTGVDENGVVSLHAGFNGSSGNPIGDGDQNILGGTGAFGDPIDVMAADFTLDGAQIATVHINAAITHTGTAASELFIGGVEDDLVSAGRGRDVVLGGDGWDDINGGRGADILFGEDGEDLLLGGGGRDRLFGDNGDDVLNGGAGRDQLTGGAGADHFVFAGVRGRDVVRDFDADQDDVIVIDVAGIDSFADVQAIARDTGRGVAIDLSDESRVVILGEDLANLSDSDFLFL